MCDNKNVDNVHTGSAHEVSPVARHGEQRIYKDIGMLCVLIKSQLI